MSEAAPPSLPERGTAGPDRHDVITAAALAAQHHRLTVLEAELLAIRDAIPADDGTIRKLLARYRLALTLADRLGDTVGRPSTGVKDAAAITALRRAVALLECLDAMLHPAPRSGDPT